MKGGKERGNEEGEKNASVISARKMIKRRRRERE